MHGEMEEEDGLLANDTLCRCVCETRHQEGKSKHRVLQVTILLLLLATTSLQIAQILQQRRIAALISTSPISYQQTEWAERYAYGQDERYQSLSHEYDYLWDVEGSDQNGVVTLGADATTGEAQLGAIGMFHQLHCLTSIRKALQRAREGEEIGIDGTADKHWPHCLNYLHQAILCSADDTIERPISEQQGNETIQIISGVGDERRCRNATALYARRAESSVLEEFRTNQSSSR